MYLWSKTLSLMSDSYRPFNDWLNVYVGIVRSRNYAAQTVKNKLICVGHLRRPLGRIPLRDIKPFHITSALKDLLPGRASTAQKVLDEARDAFAEAVAHGWVDLNPALHVRRPTCHVRRQRLKFETWREMRERARCGRTKWLGPMLDLALVTGQRRADLAKMRFEDIQEDHLFIEQQKKAGKPHGARIALPLALRLDVVSMSIGDVVEECRRYNRPGPTLIRKHNGEPLKRPDMLSYRFEDCINEVGTWPDGARPSLHECRSLSERLYRAQGVDTQTLLGHKHAAMTDRYNDDRGLSAGDWKRLVLAN